MVVLAEHTSGIATFVVPDGVAATITVSGRRLTIKQRPLVNSLAGAESAYGPLTGKVTHRGRRGQARQPHHQGHAARHWSSRAHGCASGAPAAARPCASAARDRSGVAATMVEVGKAKPKRVTRSPRNPLDPAPRGARPLPVAGHLRQPRGGAIAAGPSRAHRAGDRAAAGPDRSGSCAGGGRRRPVRAPPRLRGARALRGPRGAAGGDRAARRGRADGSGSCEDGRGGYCFELNTVLAALLRVGRLRRHPPRGRGRRRRADQPHGAARAPRR